MALKLIPGDRAERTGPLPLRLARTICSIVSARHADAASLLSLADDFDRIADMGGGPFDSTPDELRRGAFVLRELTQAAGLPPLSAIEADRSARR